MAREYAEESPKREYAPREVSPTSPEAMEPGLEPVGLAESFIAPVKAYGMALPIIKGVEKFGGPVASKVAGEMMPKTGGQMLGQAAAAGTSGVAGELASRKAPPEYKDLARTGAELVAGGALGMTPKLGRGATPAIPKERIESARYLRDIGGKPAPEQIAYGERALPTAGRLTRQQGVANEQYNAAVGLEPGKAFGKKEFTEAKNKLNSDYNSLLKDREVTLDRDFLSQIQQNVATQQQLSGYGVGYEQSKAILSSLQKLGGLPKNLQAEIDRLPRIAPTEVSSEDSMKALDLLNRTLGHYYQQGSAKIPATAYNEIRSELGDAAMRATDNKVASALRNMQSVFDKAADRSMPDIVRDLEGTRRRYEALKTLEEAQLKSGVEMGVIPAEAVGAAIKARMEQGAIYGMNNPLRQLGEAGLSLGVTAPSTGRRFSQDVERGLTPRSTMWGIIRDIANIPVYPFRSYAAGRRLEDVPEAAYAVPGAVAPLVTNPERKK